MRFPNATFERLYRVIGGPHDFVLPTSVHEMDNLRGYVLRCPARGEQVDVGVLLELGHGLQMPRMADVRGDDLDLWEAA